MKSYWQLIKRRKKLIAIVLLVFAFQSIWSDDILTDLIDEALNQNAGIRAIESQIEMLKAKEAAVRQFMDPMLTIEYSNVPLDSWVLDESAMSGVQFRMQQTFPFPGKNSVRQSVVESEQAGKTWELEELKSQLIGQLKKTYANLIMIRQLEQKSQEHLTYIKQMKASLQIRYETGKIKQHDLIRLQLMIEKLEDDLLDFKQKETEIIAMINSILNREKQLPIATPVNNNYEFHDFEIDNLMNYAVHNRPRLKKIDQELETMRLEMKLIKKERLPDITLWAGYRYRQNMGAMKNPDLASIGMSVSLPFEFTNKTKNKSQMTFFRQNAIAEIYLDEINKLRAQFETEISAYERAGEKLQTYENKLLPTAKSVLITTLAAYENNQTDFASVYQTQLQILDFEKTIINTRNQLAKSFIQIQTLLGSAKELK
jgi:Outer membrane protein